MYLVHESTIRQTMKQWRMVCVCSRIARKKPPLSKKNMLPIWSLLKLNCENQVWKNFFLFFFCRQMRFLGFWRSIRACSPPSIMVWDCSAVSWPVQLHDPWLHQQILHDNVRVSVCKLKLDKRITPKLQKVFFTKFECRMDFQAKNSPH